MAGATTYLLHGLRVRSEFPLEPPLAPGDGHEVEVGLGEPRSVPQGPPEGKLLVRLELKGARYSAVETDAGYRLRFDGVCEFDFSPDDRRISAHLGPEGGLELARVLVGGNVLSFLLTMRGQCVLHAAATERNGAALAFLGGSGMGKTTLAAMSCAAGSRLVVRAELPVGPPFPPELGSWLLDSVTEVAAAGGPD